MAVAYKCPNKHRFEVTASIDQALSQAASPPCCPTCKQPLERVATSKYNSQVVHRDGYRFGSQHEADYYEKLKLRERVGEIRNVQVHPSFLLVVNSMRIGRYTADFSFEECATGTYVVVDTKSRATRTEAYQMRKKLMLACHGITIQEVLNDGTALTS